jgi:hypothetical protein
MAFSGYKKPEKESRRGRFGTEKGTKNQRKKARTQKKKTQETEDRKHRLRKGKSKKPAFPALLSSLERKQSG